MRRPCVCHHFLKSAKSACDLKKLFCSEPIHIQPAYQAERVLKPRQLCGTGSMHNGAHATPPVPHVPRCGTFKLGHHPTTEAIDMRPRAAWLWEGLSAGVWMRRTVVRTAGPRKSHSRVSLTRSSSFSSSLRRLSPAGRRSFSETGGRSFPSERRQFTIHTIPRSVTIGTNIEARRIQYCGLSIGKRFEGGTSQ